MINFLWSQAPNGYRIEYLVRGGYEIQFLQLSPLGCSLIYIYLSFIVI